MITKEKITELSVWAAESLRHYQINLNEIKETSCICWNMNGLTLEFYIADLYLNELTAIEDKCIGFPYNTIYLEDAIRSLIDKTDNLDESLTRIMKILKDHYDTETTETDRALIKIIANCETRNPIDYYFTKSLDYIEEYQQLKNKYFEMYFS